MFSTTSYVKYFDQQVVKEARTNRIRRQYLLSFSFLIAAAPFFLLVTYHERILYSENTDRELYVLVSFEVSAIRDAIFSRKIIVRSVCDIERLRCQRGKSKFAHINLSNFERVKSLPIDM
jgi:hypothetical protein